MFYPFYQSNKSNTAICPGCQSDRITAHILPSVGILLGFITDFPKSSQRWTFFCA